MQGTPGKQYNIMMKNKGFALEQVWIVTLKGTWAFSGEGNQNRSTRSHADSKD